jgi:hypothetical protein
MKVAADEFGRPKKRCRLHGSAPGSGKQTPEGRRRITEGSSRYMKAWWADWKAKGSAPITRGCIDTRPRTNATPSPPRAKPKPMRPLTPEEIEFGRKIGLLKD